VGTTGTILIVEDDVGIRQTIAECLEVEGYRVREAASGAEALATIRDGDVPALVFLDYVMPGMNGQQFLDHLRADPAVATIPVVVMTAAMPVLSAPIDGADAMLAKPFELDDLLSVTERFCGKPPAEAGARR
jgi:CheY-like chemotaxis protein